MGPERRSNVWCLCTFLWWPFLNTVRLQEQYGGLKTQEQLLKFIHDPLVNMPPQEQLLQEESTESLTQSQHNHPSLGDLRHNMYNIFLSQASICYSCRSPNFVWRHLCCVQVGPRSACQPAVPGFSGMVTPAGPCATHMCSIVVPLQLAVIQARLAWACPPFTAQCIQIHKS